MIFVGGTIILVLVSPPLGIMADKKSRNIGYLRLVTIIVYILFLLISISTNIKPEWVLISGLIYMVGNAMYQLCFTFIMLIFW
jgi:predicted membrane channel-forming protein YqfA (hemolysin III family)